MTMTTPTTDRDPRQRTPDYTTVQMVNEGDTEFVGKYTGQTFRAAPGERIFVPFYAMCLWAGHPDAMDLDRRRRYRTDELSRLQVKYGTHSFNGCWTTELCSGNPGTDNKPKHPPTRHLPDIHFYRVEDNTEYMTVLADPEGKHTNPNVVRDASQDTLESRALRDLQVTVEKLQKELAVVQRGDVIPPAPEPTIPPVPGSSTPPSPITAPIPVSEDAINQASRGKKPKIPPTPGPLQ